MKITLYEVVCIAGYISAMIALFITWLQVDSHFKNERLKKLKREADKRAEKTGGNNG